jgi:hypothetical protein
MRIIAREPSSTIRFMNMMLLSTLALAVSFLIGACASQTPAPAPVPAGNPDTGTQEVHTY